MGTDLQRVQGQVSDSPDAEERDVERLLRGLLQALLEEKKPTESRAER